MSSKFTQYARELREKYGETQSSMAEELGVSAQFLSQLETSSGKSLRRVTDVNLSRYRSFFGRCGATKEELDQLSIYATIHNGRLEFPETMSDVKKEMLIRLATMSMGDDECNLVVRKVGDWLK